MAVIVALEVGYYFAAQSSWWNAGELRALDLQRPDSLAGWFAALVMFSTAVAACFVYSVRRYRLDDYRGRYRLWLWGASLWMLMSIDAVADLRGAVRFAGIAASGRIGPLDGLLWWLAPCATMFAWCGVRMVLDVRACRTATTALLIGMVAMGGGVALPQFSIPVSDLISVMILSGCWLVGCWMLLCAHVSFARHVLLEAHGKLPARPAKPKREKKAKQAAGDDKATTKSGANVKQRDDLTTRVDPPQASSYRPATSGIDLQKASASGRGNTQVVAPTSKPQAAPANSSSRFIGGYGEDDDDGGSQSRKLSRAERKRLRREQRAGRMGDDE
jgi:hypothetical protein